MSLPTFTPSSSSRPLVCLGVPMTGSIHPEALTSLLGVAFEIAGHNANLYCPVVDGVFPHSRARNEIVKAAEEVNADLLWFIDSDMIVPAGAFPRMLEVLRKDDDVVLVTAHTPRRGYPYTNTWSKRVKVDENGGSVLMNVEGDSSCLPSEIDSCGMACALINFKWIRDNLRKPYFKQGEYTTDHGNGPGAGLPENIWEDGFFCHQIRMLGGKIVGIPSLRCGHLGHRVVINDESAQPLREEYLRKQGQTELL